MEKRIYPAYVPKKLENVNVAKPHFVNLFFSCIAFDKKQSNFFVCCVHISHNLINFYPIPSNPTVFCGIYTMP